MWLLACGAWGLLHWHNGIVAKFPVTDPNGLKFVVTAPVGTAKTDILYFVRNSDAVKRWQANCSKERSVFCRKGDSGSNARSYRKRRAIFGFHYLDTGSHPHPWAGSWLGDPGLSETDGPDILIWKLAIT